MTSPWRIADVDDVPGLCGQVDSSVVPGMVGIEAGQSAVGDIFLWLVHNLVPDSYGADAGAKFVTMEEKMKDQPPGAAGLLALDWNNGNRSILTDVQLSGLLLGQTLHTQAHEVYRAYIEATAFGALTIIKRMEEHGVVIDEVVNTGGLSLKNETLMQIYADCLRPADAGFQVRANLRARCRPLCRRGRRARPAGRASAACRQLHRYHLPSHPGEPGGLRRAL